MVQLGVWPKWHLQTCSYLPPSSFHEEASRRFAELEDCSTTDIIAKPPEKGNLYNEL